jgi:transcription factor SPT20
MPQPTGELELSDEIRAEKLPHVPKNTQAVSRRQDDGSQKQTRTSQRQKFPSHQAYKDHLMRVLTETWIAQHQQKLRQQRQQQIIEIYRQRLFRLKHDMLVRFLPQYGPPTDWPPQLAQEYTVGLKQAAMGFTEDVMRQERVEIAAAKELLMLRQSSDRK